jgi:putative membrane protein
MLPKFILKWIITAIALAVAAKVVSGIHIVGSWTTYLWIALVFGFINATLGTIFKVFTIPFVILSLGLSLLIINALMLALTADLISSFSIDNFGAAFVASLIVSIVSMLANIAVIKPLTSSAK